MKAWMDVAAIAALAAVLTVSGTAIARDARQLVPIRADPGSPQSLTGSVYGYTLEVCSGNCNNGMNWFADSILCDGGGKSRSAAGRRLGARCTCFPTAAGRVGGFASTRVVFYKSGP